MVQLLLYTDPSIRCPMSCSISIILNCPLRDSSLIRLILFVFFTKLTLSLLLFILLCIILLAFLVLFSNRIWSTDLVSFLTSFCSSTSPILLSLLSLTFSWLSVSIALSLFIPNCSFLSIASLVLTVFLLSFFLKSLLSSYLFFHSSSKSLKFTTLSMFYSFHAYFILIISNPFLFILYLSLLSPVIAFVSFTSFFYLSEFMFYPFIDRVSFSLNCLHLSASPIDPATPPSPNLSPAPLALDDSFTSDAPSSICRVSSHSLVTSDILDSSSLALDSSSNPLVISWEAYENFTESTTALPPLDSVEFIFRPQAVSSTVDVLNSTTDTPAPSYKFDSPTLNPKSAISSSSGVNDDMKVFKFPVHNGEITVISTSKPSYNELARIAQLFPNFRNGPVIIVPKFVYIPEDTTSKVYPSNPKIFPLNPPSL